METAHERVLREDMILFINGCFAATGQSEFYHRAMSQRASLSFVHEYMRVNYRSLYALTLACHINDHNTGLIVQNLLENPVRYAYRELEGELIRRALRRMAPQRVYRLFKRLRSRRINNRRTRATIKAYMASRPDLAFDAVKYRGGFAAGSRHAHLALEEDVGKFIFEPKTKRFETELFETWRAAKYSQDAVYKLPYSIAEGFAKRHDIPRARFLKKIEPMMTKGERQRLMRAADRVGVSYDVDLSKMPLERLLAWIGALPFSERDARGDELESSIRAAAQKVVRKIGPHDTKIASVIDTSYSTKGSRERRNRPLSTGLGVAYLFDAMTPNHSTHFTCAVPDSRFKHSAIPRGQTSIARPLLDALETEPDWVIIVSDGWENNPPRATDGVMRLYETLETNTSILHVNPVFDAARYEPRRLSDRVPTVGIRRAEDILVVLPFVEFASGRRTSDELVSMLEREAERFVGGGNA